MRGMTIAKVAAQAGVGVGTVSRVLNGSPSVSEETRQRVLEAIAALDYRPNAVARALSTGRTYAVGVVAPFFTSWSVIERLRGVSRTLAAAGYQLILLDVERAEQGREFFRTVAVRGRVDGVLSISLMPTDAEIRRLQTEDVPIVLLDRAHPALPAITIDDVDGGRMAAEHLLELGHRRFAVLADRTHDERVAGHREVLEAAGAEWTEAARFEPGPTAVLAATDTLALSVLEAGVRVPQEVSVIGFDDIPAAAAARLTTVRQPLFEKGEWAGRLLAEGAAGREVILPVELVVRGSTAAPPA
jgi:LacI family transcriptional regulator